MMSEQANTKVITGTIRMSYVNLFEPRALAEGQDKKYSLCILIPKSDKSTLQNISAAVDTAKQAGQELWGGKIPSRLRLPLRDGDVDRPDQPEYAGHYFLSASSKQKPGIVDKNLQTIPDQSELYSGCYGRVSLKFFPFNSAGNKGVGCGLQNVQKLAEAQWLKPLDMLVQQE